MAKTYDLLIKARGETKDAERAMKQLQRTVDGAGKKMQSTGRLMTTAITAPIAAIAALGIKEAIETRAVTAKTDAVMQSMGATMKVTKGEVLGLASELQRYSAIEDDVIQSAENIGLTFSQLAGNPDLFKRTMRAAVDMSSALDQSVQTSVIQLGKAMQNGAKGAAALGKNGTLAKDDIAKLQKMAEDGLPIWKQQEFILAAVNKQYAGQGKNTDPIKGLGLAMKDIAQTLATRLLPVVDGLAVKMQAASVWVEQLSPHMQNMIGIGALVAAAIGPVVWGLGAMVSAGAALLPVLMAVTAPMLLVGAAVVGLGVAFVAAYSKSERFRDVVNRSFRAVAQTVGAILSSLRQTISVWVGWARSAWAKWGDDAMTVLRPVWRSIQTIAGTALQNMRDSILVILAALRGDWSQAGELLKGIARRAWAAIKTIFENGTTANKNAVKLLAKGIRGLAGLFADAGSALGRALVNAIADYVRNNAGNLASEIAGALGGPLGSAVDQTVDAVQASNRSGRGKKGIKNTASGVGVLGALFGNNVQVGQVLSYASNSSNQPYSVTSNADGTQSLQTNQAVVDFITARIERSRALLAAKITARNAKVNQNKALAAAYRGLASQKARARTATARAALAKKMAANLRQREAVVDAIENLNMEILALGGDIEADQDALVAPEIDSTSNASPAQEDNSAENLRRLALGLPSVEEERQLAAVNAIRSANGLATVGSLSEIGGSGATAGGAAMPQLVIRQTFTGQPDLFAASRQAAWAARTAGLVIA